MRRVAGGMEHLVAWIALLALSACTSAVRSHEQLRAVEICELDEIAAHTADSAVVVFHATTVPLDHCALRLAAASLRPWPAQSDERWTVAIERPFEWADTMAVRATVHRLHGTRARDALDTGLVLMATEDLELVAYATARSDLVVAPLPWDRTYLRVGTPSREPLGSVDPTAVRVDARRAEPLLDCEARGPAAENRSASVRSGRAVYLAGDRTAREIAERIVGIDGASEVAGLTTAELDVALLSGADLAYVVSIPHTSDACHELVALTARAPWIDSGSITALIDTRAHAITRRTQQP